jgi:hypothetical protein
MILCKYLLYLLCSFIIDLSSVMNVPILFYCAYLFLLFFLSKFSGNFPLNIIFITVFIIFKGKWEVYNLKFGCLALEKW